MTYDNDYISYEVRIYHYALNGFMDDDKLYKELIESFGTIEEALQCLSNELCFLNPNEHYYIWITRMEWFDDYEVNT
jgi:hypothetical protein